MPEAPGRLEVIAALLTLAGVVLVARSAARLARVVRARFTYGAPYREGMIADRLLGLLMAAPVAAAGVALVLLAIVQAEFQPSAGTVRVGQIEARRTGWGRMHVRFVPDPRYPADRVLEAEISGARWAVVGDFVAWSRPLRWLGLRDGHRVRALVGTNDTTGTTASGRADRATLDPLPPAARRFLGAARFLPFVTVRSDASSWFPPAERQVIVLYALGAGYLADVAAAGAPAAAAPAQNSN